MSPNSNFLNLNSLMLAIECSRLLGNCWLAIVGNYPNHDTASLARYGAGQSDRQPAWAASPPAGNLTTFLRR